MGARLRALGSLGLTPPAGLCHLLADITWASLDTDSGVRHEEPCPLPPRALAPSQLGGPARAATRRGLSICPIWFLLAQGGRAQPGPTLQVARVVLRLATSRG